MSPDNAWTCRRSCMRRTASVARSNCAPTSWSSAAACCGPIWGRRNTSLGCRNSSSPAVPPAQSFTSKRLHYSNWLQAMEGGIDSSHVSFLHRDALHSDPLMRGARGNQYNMTDAMVRFEAAEHAAGLFIGARRRAEQDSYYWRITPWCMPSFHHDSAARRSSGPRAFLDSDRRRQLLGLELRLPPRPGR